MKKTGSPFSEFIRNASPEERALVYGRVSKKSQEVMDKVMKKYAKALSSLKDS